MGKVHETECKQEHFYDGTIDVSVSCRQRVGGEGSSRKTQVWQVFKNCFKGLILLRPGKNSCLFTCRVGQLTTPQEENEKGKESENKNERESVAEEGRE